jgi:hypothetical protein
MRTRTKSLAVGVASALTVITTGVAVSAPAQAAPLPAAKSMTVHSTRHDVRPLGVVTWTRSCGTTYGGLSTSAYALTNNGSDGSCKGDAWVRVKWRGSWSGWVHNPSEARINVGSGLQAAQHKGCADCHVYTTYP